MSIRDAAARALALDLLVQAVTASGAATHEHAVEALARIARDDEENGEAQADARRFLAYLAGRKWRDRFVTSPGATRPRSTT